MCHNDCQYCAGSAKSVGTCKEYVCRYDFEYCAGAAKSVGTAISAVIGKSAGAAKNACATLIVSTARVPQRAWVLIFRLGGGFL